MPFIGCNPFDNSDELIKEGIKNQNNNSALAIGDTHQGGIIFWLDGNGGGLVAAPSDQSSRAGWGCTIQCKNRHGYNITGAEGTAIGTGAQNTIDIEAECTTPGTAADICANLTLGGYSDWFLPSKDELNQMYVNKAAIGGFPEEETVRRYLLYISSSESEYVEWRMWLQNFFTGNQSDWSKENSYNVRAIRAF